MLSRNEGRIAQAYHKRVAAGELVHDPAQRQAVQSLDRLGRELAERSNRRGWFDRLLRPRQERGEKSGIYLAGKVGRGKTMLMDMLFDSVNVTPKRRVHFNAFMQEVHGKLHNLRHGQNGGEAVAAAAKQIAEDAKLLCLDEFQVNDIADAMLLGRLFEALIAEDVFIVVSSNTELERLYEEGLNRQLFLPFIALIGARFELIEVKGGTDYRLKRIAGEDIYHWPLGEKADRHLQRLWEMLTDGARGEPLDIKVRGRRLHVPHAARGVTRFSFAALCEAPLGPADYLALAERFETVFIERVPMLGHERRDATRRFISLVDIFYDVHVRLVVSAMAPPGELAPGFKDFERAVSRLQEMQGGPYWSFERKT